MSFARLSSDTGGGADDAVDADAGAGGDTAGGAWLTGFFFNMLFFSSMVMYQIYHKVQHRRCKGNRCRDKTVGCVAYDRKRCLM